MWITETNHWNINRVSSEMNAIFPISDDNKDWSLDSSFWVGEIVLQLNTAKEKLQELNKEFSNVNIMFSNLIKEDSIGPAIIKLAKSDPDFNDWLMQKAIKYSDFSDVDRINQYLAWAKWDWYNFTWAIENRELLSKAVDHMSWMNILTSDRPIDSPRYVSMQSIAWNEIKLIYPNLFKVEVFTLTWQNKSWFDIHELKTSLEIKESLIKYLSWKVAEYNTILENEYKGALSMDARSQRLLNNWYSLATSTTDKSIRSYDYFTYDEFVEALGWSGMIDTIADMLHYQSLTNTRKLSTWSVAKDIELIKNSFNLNDKREKTLQDYLTYKNEETKSPLFVIPNYELFGYEVAYVNSDWKDYIVPNDDVDKNLITQFTKSNSKRVDNRQPTWQEQNLTDECNIPESGTLSLFALSWGQISSPWLVWFKCWLKKLEEGPVKLRLSFDNALWNSNWIYQLLFDYLLTP